MKICEQLGWRAPENIIIPVESGALLCAIWRGLKQFKELGLINDFETRLIGAQPEGCSPIVKAYKDNSEDIFPVEKPETIAKSLAIGDPADGVYALSAIKESGGLAEHATDEEIVEGMKLLAKTEGIFAEPAGGVAIDTLKELVESCDISRDEEVVCCITGSGFKSPDIFSADIRDLIEVEPSFENIRKLVVPGGVVRRG